MHVHTHVVKPRDWIRDVIFYFVASDPTSIISISMLQVPSLHTCDLLHMNVTLAVCDEQSSNCRFHVDR